MHLRGLLDAVREIGPARLVSRGASLAVGEKREQKGVDLVGSLEAW
jgi:hypothetical protein